MRDNMWFQLDRYFRHRYRLLRAHVIDEQVVFGCAHEDLLADNMRSWKRWQETK